MDGPLHRVHGDPVPPDVLDCRLLCHHGQLHRPLQDGGPQRLEDDAEPPGRVRRGHVWRHLQHPRRCHPILAAEADHGLPSRLPRFLGRALRQWRVCLLRHGCQDHGREGRWGALQRVWVQGAPSRRVGRAACHAHPHVQGHDGCQIKGLQPPRWGPWAGRRQLWTACFLPADRTGNLWPPGYCRGGGRPGNPGAGLAFLRFLCGAQPGDWWPEGLGVILK
mmetsp:Transcript_23232/g.53945  ORF Transcript_23232/g.53945 Transcript_23232/m.53945 type:complete len:221 (+) Transcript_23232:517-1179(+)